VGFSFELTCCDGKADAPLLLGVATELQELVRAYLESRSKLLLEDAGPLLTGMLRTAQAKGTSVELQSRNERARA